MSEPAERTTRRHLLFGAGAGAIVGAAWATAIQVVANASVGSVAIAGYGSSQIVLIDHAHVRVLVLLGSPDERTLASIPKLLTMMRQRIDILIGSFPSLGSLPSGFNKQWNVAHTFGIPMNGSGVPDTRIFTSVTDDTRLDIAPSFSIEINRAYRNAWTTVEPAQEHWSATATIGQTRIDLAPEATAVEALPPPDSAILIVPTGDPDQLTEFARPAAIAINARDDLVVPGPCALVRVFPDDIARFSIDGDKITLPAWTVAGHSAR